MPSKKKTSKLEIKPVRKLFLLVVEGRSDFTALHLPLEQFLEQLYPGVMVEVIYQRAKHGDLTSDKNVDEGNIEKKLKRQVNEYCTFDLHLNGMNSITEIVFITDTDGCFIGAQNIEEDTNLNGYYYEDERILTPSIQDTTLRNQRKSKNIETLARLDKLGIVPFSTYYFSCNLDDMLCSKKNISDDEKGNMAEGFRTACEIDDMHFLRFFEEDSGSFHKGTYADSWRYIKEGTNSLKRRTNFNLFIERMVRNRTVSEDALSNEMREYIGKMEAPVTN